MGIKVAAATAVYIAGLVLLGVFLTGSQDGSELTAVVSIGAVWSFFYGLVVARFETVVLPTVGSIALFFAMLPPADDYSWMDNGGGMVFFYLAMAGFAFVVLAGATVLGVVAARTSWRRHPAPH